MPSEYQSGVGGRERRTFPDLAEDIGHDPARFLDWRLVGSVDDGRKMLLKAVVQGIDRIEVIRAYQAVERALGRGSNGGPREGVMRLLDQREEHLEEIGERPDRIAFGPRQPCDCCNEDQLTASELRERRDEERDRMSAGYSPAAADTSATSPKTETATLGEFGEVATDGGESA